MQDEVTAGSAGHREVGRSEATPLCSSSWGVRHPQPCGVCSEPPRAGSPCPRPLLLPPAPRAGSVQPGAQSRSPGRKSGCRSMPLVMELLPTWARACRELAKQAGPIPGGSPPASGPLTALQGPRPGPAGDFRAAPSSSAFRPSGSPPGSNEQAPPRRPLFRALQGHSPRSPRGLLREPCRLSPFCSWD